MLDPKPAAAAHGGRKETAMTYREHVVTTRTEEEPVAGQVVSRSTTFSPSSGEILRRFVVLIFGLIQVDILLRIVLLLLNAQRDNGIVQFIYNTSQLFVAPFEGIFRTNALHAGGSVLDVSAIAALIGWTVLEAIVLWIVSIFRREPYSA
jgi:hypothetical protein